MNRYWRVVAFMSGMLIIFSFSIVIQVVDHERIHQLIFKDHGIQSYVEYFFIEQLKHPFSFDQPAAWTVPYNYTGTNKTCDSFCEAQHEELEIVSHGANIVFVGIILSIFLMVVYFEFVRGELKLKNWTKEIAYDDKKEVFYDIVYDLE